MRYEGNVYRPPSEARSLIVQVTVGCSHNACTFCSMYRGDRFRVRSFEEVAADLRGARSHIPHVRRIFLADGDALCLATDKLLDILNLIKELYPECERVGIYGSARDVLRKSEAELSSLLDAGLGIVYLGAESGSPEVLRRINKNATAEELIESVRKIEDAGLSASVTFISGMGGRELMEEHAAKTGEMISKMQPSYVGVLTLMLERGAPIVEDIERGHFQLLTPPEVVREMEIMLENINLEKTCVFRSNHASNYLSLKGNLPEDKEHLLAAVRRAKEDPSMLKEEYFRAL